ncbi:PfkB family carbohydrate kinase [Flexivirga aerilata]|uniref:PfkB family carbohydrate kinase n=1 Tax=Flexivirga aerilata TaxID=1656889 RepID=UPI0031B5C4D4
MSGSAEADIVVVGDVLLDRDLIGTTDRLCPDAPAPVVDVRSVRSGPGGAGLAALLAAPDTRSVTLVAPIADDARGAQLRALLEAHGVQLVAMEHLGATRRKTRVRAGSYSLTRFDEGGPGTPGVPPEEALRRIRDADAVLVADYGAGTAAEPHVRAALQRRARAGGLLIWDPHPRGGPPVAHTTVVTPNLSEAHSALGQPPAVREPAELALGLLRAWEAAAVCVTCGADGAWLATTEPEPYFVPAAVSHGTDSCGAGDCLSVAVTLALTDGATTPEAVHRGVQAASRWVAQGGTASFRERQGPAENQQCEANSALSGPRGVLVATGGCFDVLHAGHLASLEAARQLGDGLVVLLNSDSSVRRRKGPGRPVQPVHDRARVLRALSVVDDVVVFDEDDPSDALRRIRPDIWAKGGDYDAHSLPEAEVVRSWGGRVVLLPYLNGRSTTSLLRRHQERTMHDNVS